MRVLVRLCLFGVPFVVVHILLSWTSSLRYPAVGPLKPLNSGPSYQQDGRHLEEQSSYQQDGRHWKVGQTVVSSEEEQSSLCEEPARDGGPEEVVKRYRYCMDRLVAHSHLRLEEQTTSPNRNTTGTAGELRGERWREMASRLAALRGGCRVPAVELTGAAGYEDIVFDKKHHLAYSRHAKAGTTSLLSLLLSLNNVEPGLLTPTEIHQRIFTLLPKPSKEKIRDVLKRSLSFTAVRHPFRRLVSAYCNKAVEANYPLISEPTKRMSPEERAKELLKYEYRVEPGTPEPVMMVGPWIRRAAPPLGHGEEGALLAHYFTADGGDYLTQDRPSTADQQTTSRDKKTHGRPSTAEQQTTSRDKKTHGRPSPADQQTTIVSRRSGDKFRHFVHSVIIDLLGCQSAPSCLKNTDVHVMPQTIRFNPCVLHFDMVMKVESLDEDISLLKELLMIPDIEDGGTRGSYDTLDNRTMNNSDKKTNNSDKRKEETVNHGYKEQSQMDQSSVIHPHRDRSGSVTSDGPNKNKMFDGDNDTEQSRAEHPSLPGSPDPSSGVVFYKRNTSGKQCTSYEENMKQLTKRDIDLLYTAYYRDFKLFAYDPFS